MNILLEGPDGSGKTTLAQHLQRLMGFDIIQGDGPPRNSTEWAARSPHLFAQLKLDNLILDRVHLVSQTIFGQFREGIEEVNPYDRAHFYSSAVRPLIIYCKGSPELENHDVKPHETAEHIAMVNKNQRRICNLYDQWGAKHADFIYDYRRPGDMDKIVWAVHGIQSKLEVIIP